MPFNNWFRGTSGSLWNTKWGATILVAVVGLAATLGLYGVLRGDVAEEARGALASQGELLRQTVENDAQLVIEQARGFRGLFEASVNVTPEEFEIYSLIVGTTPSSAWVYATPRGLPDQSVLWLVRHVVGDTGLGFSLGTNLYRDPVQAAAIDRAVVGREPTVSGFIELDGDVTPGDVAVFVPVTLDGSVVGLIGAILQLDELLEGVAEQVLSPGQSWALDESIAASGEVSTSHSWSSSLHLGLRHFRLSVETDGFLSPGSERPIGALIAGVLITALAALLIHDLQRRRKTEGELEWLRRSSVDKDRFLAGVGHELRTPLTAVIGMLELVIDRVHELNPGERTELLATARHNAYDIARIVDDFVAAGRLSADALTVRSQPTDLDAVVAKLIAAAHFDTRLKVETATGLGSCLGDGLRVTQILLNLLHNACRNARGSVQIGGRRDSQAVTVEVRNDGPAIATEMSNRLFEPFRNRTEGQPQPVGLGLSVSRALARRMGGDLVYEWREGLVVFSLTLPALPLPVAA